MSKYVENSKSEKEGLFNANLELYESKHIYKKLKGGWIYV